MGPETIHTVKYRVQQLGHIHWDTYRVHTQSDGATYTQSDIHIPKVIYTRRVHTLGRAIDMERHMYGGDIHMEELYIRKRHIHVGDIHTT